MRAFTLLGFILVGCSATSSPGGSSAADGGHAGPVPFDQVTNEFANTSCAGFGTCCQSKGFAFDSSACIANLQQVDLSALCAPPHVYDAQAAGECLADMQAVLGSCGELSQLSPACGRMCTGTVAPGGTCTTIFDCAASSVGTPACLIQLADNSAPNACIVNVHAHAGDACNQTCVDSQNGGGLVCSGAPGSSTQLECYASDGLYCAPDRACRPLVAPGGGCADQPACQAGSYCDLTSSTCVPHVATGAPCPKQVECGTTDYCDDNNTCAPKKAAGAACSGFLGECQQGRCGTSTSPSCVTTIDGLTVSAQTCANPSPILL